MSRNPRTLHLATSVALLVLGLAALPGIARAAASASFPAAATSTPGTCKANDQCGKDEFCAKLFGRCGDSGKCEAKPADCIEHGGKVLIRPVCGCDGKDYDSVCVAAIAGASVDHEGSCKP